VAHVGVIVVAAGSGTRFGRPKQFESLGRRSVAGHSVRVARECGEFTVLVVPEGYHGDGEGADVVVTGGATRSDSVRAGVAALPERIDTVVIHDAARPLATLPLFRQVLDALSDDVAGAIPAIAVTDTLKKVVDGDVTETVDRSSVIAVQTPQAFRLDALRAAHEGQPSDTDDAAALERLGYRVVVVECETTNLKITHPHELTIVRAVLGVE
jgi:2-C-methyl-D-erythritol 4-phosphate cytidylyltransferase